MLAEPESLARKPCRGRLERLLKQTSEIAFARVAAKAAGVAVCRRCECRRRGQGNPSGRPARDHEPALAFENLGCRHARQGTAACCLGKGLRRNA